MDRDPEAVTKEEPAATSEESSILTGMESAQERTTAPGRSMQDVSTILVSCTSCYMFTDQKEEKSNFICQKCRFIALLEEKVKRLEERITTLRFIKESEDFLDRTVASLLITDVDGSTRKPPREHEWKQVTKRSRRPVMTSPAIKLRNSFQGLGEVDDDTPKDGAQKAARDVDATKEEEPPTNREKETQRHLITSSSKQEKKKRRVVVVGDSLLRGTEATICRPDKEAREVCCLPGAKINDVTTRIPKIFSSKDVHPFLLIHVGTNDTARKDLPTISRDFEELGNQVSDFEVTTNQDLGELQSVRLYKETYLFPVQDAWYGQYVNVTAPEGKLYKFPVYQWISGQTSVQIPRGEACIALMSSTNIYLEDRRRQLEKNRELYKWKMYFPGAPHCIDADSIDNLPPNEKYSSLKRGSFGLTVVISELQVGLQGLTSNTNSWSSLDDIKTVFYFKKSNVSIEVSQIWNEDSFFGYQYLNGVNPMQIRKCLKLPENFPVSSGMVAASLGTSTDLQKEIQRGNVFLANYKILQGIPANDCINGKKQYLTAPMCLLWKNPQDQLLPIAIQLGQTPGEKTPVFLPSDSKWDWMLAKIWVRSAEFQVHQTVHHLLHTHLFAEVFNVATHRQLPCNHPVYKLLIPHLRYTLDINTLARKELIGPGAIFDQNVAVGKVGVQPLVKKAMEQLTYSGLCLPDDIQSRGLDSVPNFYYRDDGRMIWDAVERFVSNIVKYYYKSEESVRRDPELQAWVAEIYDKGFLQNKSSGIPSSLETVSSLVKYLTMVIFRCSAQHAGINSAQFDFYAWMPNGPTSMKSPPPTSKGVTTLQTILDTLPDINTSINGLLITMRLSEEPQDRRPLGCYPNVHFTEEIPQKNIKDFQVKLAEISKTINERNQTRRLSYLYLDPKMIENSISI